MQRTVEKRSKQIIPILVLVFTANIFFSQLSLAQVAFLPPVGSMVNMTPKYEPLLIKGVKFFVDNPFKFEFIVDKGQESLGDAQIKDEGQKLSSYFLAALTTPEKEMWVNLSPFEKGRVIPKGFGDTEMGKEILGQDYVLKQIMATALYPDNPIGRTFWDKVYAEAAKRFGTTNVPINTFNKVWIVPDEAYVYENPKMNAVFVVKSSLKVMMERDYLAANKNKAMEQFGMSAMDERDANATSDLSAQMIKEIVIPALEKEVNEGKNFAKLRQVYQALILAAWYKKNLKDSVLTKGYVDRNKTLGVDTKDKQINEKIYAQYLIAYKKGAYNLVREEMDPTTNQLIPRKYFSGGVNTTMLTDRAMRVASKPMVDLFMNEMLGEAAERIVSLLVNVFMGSNPIEAVKSDFQEKKTSLFNKYEDQEPVLTVLSVKENKQLTGYVHSELEEARKEIIRNINTQQFSSDSLREIAVQRVIDSTVNQIVQIVVNFLREKGLLGSPTTKDGNNKPPMLSMQDIEQMVQRLWLVRPGPPPEKVTDVLKKELRDLLLKSDTPVSNATAQSYMSRLIGPYVVVSSISMPSLGVNISGGLNTSNFANDNSLNDGGSRTKADPSQVGGIDLEKINLMIKQGSTNIKTAFSDEKILNLLVAANGLFPQVQLIKPLNGVGINHYLGNN